MRGRGLPMVVADLVGGYLEVVQHVLDHGVEVSPRGQRTLEVAPGIIAVADPRRVVPVGVGRGLNLAIGAAESCHLLGGFSDAAQLVSATKNFAQFVEGGRLRGAYGPRVQSQVPLAIARLAADRDTRQASVVIGRRDDLATPTKDLPCTREIAFAVRADRLNMFVTMRSNDVFWGLPYDAWMFANLQCAVAYCLGVGVGTYHHYAYSLHAYVDRDGEKLKLLYQYTGEKLPPMLVDDLPQEGSPAERWNAVQEYARRAALAAEYDRPELPPSVAWYRDMLLAHQSGGHLCRECRYVSARPEILCQGVR